MLNGIAVSAPYLHFAPVILLASRLSYLANHMQLCTTARNEEKQIQWYIDIHYHSVASFNYMCPQVYYICYYAVHENTAG